MPLDDDAPAHHGAVGGVALFGMVGMQRVRVVERNGEGAGEHPLIFARRKGKALRDAGEHAFQKAAARALQRVTAHLLAVEACRDKHALALIWICQSGEGSGDARQIVDARRREKFPVAAACKGLFGAGGEQIEGERAMKGASEFLLPQRPEREKVGLRVGGELLVDRAVHMDGERGDDDVLFAHIGLGDEYALLFAHDAPRDLQGAVEKGVTDAAAVRFDVEPREGAVRKGGVFFELEGGRVGVRGDDLEGAFGAFPDAEGDERAAAPRDKILLAAL